MAEPRTNGKVPCLGLVAWPSLALVALIFSLAALIDPAPSSEGRRPEPRAPTYRSDQQLEGAWRMTERMRTGAGLDPSGRMADGGVPGDEQHPQDQVFIEELEGYQQTLDRMLGRGAP